MPVQSDTLTAAPAADSLLSAIELQTGVPLQDVAEPSTSCQAPLPIQVVEDDEAGLSDNENESFYLAEQDRADTTESLSHPSTTAASPVDPSEGELNASVASSSSEKVSGDNDTVVSVYRNDPYSFIAVAYEDTRDGEWTDDDEWMQEPESIPAGTAAFVTAPRDEVIADDDWDAPAPPKRPALLPVDAGLEAEPAAHERLVLGEWDAPAPQPRRQRRSGPSVMCCYFKQTGRCKMGADCWYSHDGYENTPCHYGAMCKAGHAHLSKTGLRSRQSTSNRSNVDVTPYDGPEPSGRPMGLRRAPRHADDHAVTSSKNTTSHQAPQARRVAPGPQHLSAALKPSSLPCAFCGGSDCVLIQEFPVYEGNQRLVGQRAHCRQCLRTYAL